MPRLGAVFCVSMALWVQPTKAAYYGYSEWAALPEVSRAIFMSGAFDSLVSFATDADGAAAAKHYAKCVHGAHMTNGQLATNILNYARDKPALHTQLATAAMLDYLIAACGLPPQQPKPK
ncbi:MAG: hypothetical protein E7813_06695 [Bradyrhizobium sp.]|uniref:hypothetical protein n=1 Tax=Bradyrhizobium sp. TaxID=376 RepID=UPI00122445EB|nr:hypothetical protein [Bradyrhizobium sp.]THD70957.1 MAG: hypothetical protein E7813_06695 [Bradyrhizobium sp.]